MEAEQLDPVQVLQCLWVQGICFIRGSVNVPHLKMHLSEAGTVNVCNPLHCILLQSAIVKSSVPVCVLAMWADWKDIYTLVYHVPSCLLHPPPLASFVFFAAI